MDIEGIDIKDIEFGEPIEEREPNYRDGYIRGIYRAKNIIDSKQREIERLNKRILALEETIRKANNNVLKDIAMIKTHEMIKQEIVQRLIETSKILESGSDKE